MEQARIGHTWYRDTFLTRFITDGTLENVFSGDGNNIGSVEPGFWNFNLNRAARGHCTYVIKHPSYRDKNGGHDDANGTSTNTRITKFSEWNSEIYINEGPGSGLNRGFASVGSWICDGYHLMGRIVFGSCCRDSGKNKTGHSCVIGHRTGIMQSCLQFGCGVDGVGGPHHLSGSYTTTCDCLNRATVKYAGKHIASASHVGDPLNSGKFMYLATILTTGITVSSVIVVEEVGTTSNTITLTAANVGSKGAVYTSPSYAELTDCRTYYFTLKYGSTTERYPEAGYFYTYGMSCDTDWMATKPTVQCTSGVCCDTATGTFKPRTTVCSASSGACENDAYCTGSGSSCPAKTKKASGTVCRAKSGDCDVAEVCDGKSAACPADKYATSTTKCATASGPCENDAYCTGSSTTCPAKTKKASGTVCRVKNGDCDVAETCDGSNAACPADKYASSGTKCSSATGVCENDAYCTGSSSSCPARTKKAAGTVCRAKSGDCDAAEVCDGTSAACPADKYAPSGTRCSNATGACENDAFCTGSDATCPARTKKAAGTTCRAAQGLCDVAETCDGTGAACPADGFAPAGTPCNATYNCTGRSAHCPSEPAYSEPAATGAGFPLAATIGISVAGALLLAAVVVVVALLLVRRRRNGSSSGGRSNVELESGTAAPPRATTLSDLTDEPAMFSDSAPKPKPKPAPAAAATAAATSSAAQPAKPSYLQKKKPATPPAHAPPRREAAPPPPAPRSRPAHPPRPQASPAPPPAPARRGRPAPPPPAPRGRPAPPPPPRR